MELRKISNLKEKWVERAITENLPCQETVVTSLNQALSDLEKGTETANKVLIIFFDDSSSKDFPTWQIYLGGMAPTEGIGVCALAAEECKQLMLPDE